MPPAKQPTALPIAAKRFKLDAHPAQEFALESTYFYDVMGLSDPATGVPDYLVTPLEFLAAVSFTKDNTFHESARASRARAKSEFLERHWLNWLPTAAMKLDETEAPGFPFRMNLRVRFLRREPSATVQRPTKERWFLLSSSDPNH